MFVRKKKNRSGTTTVVVVEKRAGRHVYVRSIGSSTIPSEIGEMVRQAEEFIKEEERGRKPELDFDGAEEKALERDKAMAEEVFSSIESVVMDTPRQILDRVYDSIGFLSRFGRQPMHFFGASGILMFLVGFALTLWVIIDKLVRQAHGLRFRAVTDQPLFYLALVALILGVMLFLAGFVGEMISRSSTSRNNYNIRERI